MISMLPDNWKQAIAPYYDLNGSSCRKLEECVRDAYNGPIPVYPPHDMIYSALRLTSPKDVKCIIIGQDPYHEPGQAMGLSFSVPVGTPLPPSLRNIYKELSDDLQAAPPANGDLTHWAKQGVLLLNNVLSVYEGKAGSHRAFGWQMLTGAIVRAIADNPTPVAAILWGKDAQSHSEVLKDSKYPRFVLCSPHPSPLSSYRGFFGSKPFSQVNDFLKSNGASPINWVEEGELL